MFTETNGFLFIGDPHLCSRRVGRRKDDYVTSVLTKLEACAELCKSKKLTAVVLGDLFHRNDDGNLPMMNRLIRVLKAFPEAPIVLEGNHDKERTDLGDDDALMLLHQTGLVRVAMDPGVFEIFTVHGQQVNLLMAPYGTELPDAAPDYLEGTSVLVTHHDMAFGHAYPGSQPLKAIAGVAMVVNGHMHDTKPSETVGGTVWHNPGNIEPLSLDLAAHVPCAWEWAPEQGVQALTAHPLPHGTDLFDLTGVQVQATDALEGVTAAIQTSAFAELLGGESALEAQQTDDASVLKEDLEAVLAAANASPASQVLLRALAGSLAD